MKAPIYQFFQLLSVKLRQEDKIKHMVWSFWLTLIALLFWSVSTALVVVFLLGLAKECWDSRYGSGFCWFDMTGNLLGSLAALLCGSVLSAMYVIFL